MVSWRKKSTEFHTEECATVSVRYNKFTLNCGLCESIGYVLLIGL